MFKEFYPRTDGAKRWAYAQGESTNSARLFISGRKLVQGSSRVVITYLKNMADYPKKKVLKADLRQNEDKNDP